MVLVSKAHRRAVYEYLIDEGVIVVKKDPFLRKHQHITSVSNIVVMIIVWLLKRRKYLNGVFNWQWSFYMLNDAGVKYLCEYLVLPEDVVPATYKKINVARENNEGETRVADSHFSENEGAKSKFPLG